MNEIVLFRAWTKSTSVVYYVALNVRRLFFLLASFARVHSQFSVVSALLIFVLFYSLVHNYACLLEM